MSTLASIFLVAIFLLTPSRGFAGGVYQIHSLSEKQLQQTYITMLEEACPHADSEWHNSTFSPDAGFWGDGASAGNEGIRCVASMVLSCATLIKYDDHLTVAQREELLRKSTQAIRFCTETHLTGTQKCPDGRHWGASEKMSGAGWQSGMWTGSLAFGAWLIWDKLDPALQQGVEHVVASEDDVLSRNNPPNNLWLDTKAEENGWEVPCLALGELMFPKHPHAAMWRVKARDYMMNTLCTEADLHDTNLVDGRAVNQWVRGANLQPDFTLENHNIFHPSYVGCSSYFLAQTRMYYTFAGQPIPQAASHRLFDTWNMFRTIIMPTGEAAYPQSMDWELHGLPFENLFASFATHDHDALAACMEERYVQYVRAWQVMRHGDMAIPGSRLGITRHAICAEQVALGYLAHKIFGPAARPLSEHAAAAKSAGVWDRPYVDFVSHRTEKKFVSFSWKNRFMGMLMPIADHEENPAFTAPIVNGFVGSFELTPTVPNKTAALEHSRKMTADGFDTTGALLLNSGRLKQTVRMISIGAQTVVYEDRVVAVSNVTIRAERGLPIGIENDEITGGQRTLFHGGDNVIFDQQHPKKAVTFSGPWANVDGRLGIVMLTGTNLTYVQAGGYTPGISICSDILYGSYSDQPREFKAGDEVTHRIAVLYVEVTPKETARLAKSCRLEKTSNAEILHFKQPDGTKSEVSILKIVE